MKRVAYFLFLSSTVLGLDTKPWFGNAWELEGQGAFTYSRYPKVDQALVPLAHPSNDQLLAFNLGLSTNSSSSFDGEVEFTNTPRLPWSTRSVAVQWRKLFWDDVLGDFLSVATGTVVRFVPTRALTDVSTPYHSNCNFEVNLAIGKEWACEAMWRYRMSGYFGLGMANRGFPWTRLRLFWEKNREDQQQIQLFGDAYFGFGPKREVNIKHFHGYAQIHHQSVDLGISYRYLWPIWGSISLEGGYRILAHSFPEHLFFVTASYRLPFSF